MVRRSKQGSTKGQSQFFQVVIGGHGFVCSTPPASTIDSLFPLATQPGESNRPRAPTSRRKRATLGARQPGAAPPGIRPMPPDENCVAFASSLLRSKWRDRRGSGGRLPPPPTMQRIRNGNTPGRHPQVSHTADMDRPQGLLAAYLRRDAILTDLFPCTL